jgi:crotonobetainyl-CoA:carnitine CoA-transferase CaiB-like acyl-CoA transferase
MSSRSPRCWRTAAASSQDARDRARILRICTAASVAITLNLKDLKGLEVFERLAQQADVVV